ncbi:MAG: GGGtGRT protein [Clostridia bacterium]|nr:GGGtGRT protein [Clostridia bacterium]
MTSDAITIGMGNNPMVGATVSLAVAVSLARK